MDSGHKKFLRHVKKHLEESYRFLIDDLSRILGRYFLDFRNLSVMHLNSLIKEVSESWDITKGIVHSTKVAEKYPDEFRKSISMITMLRKMMD